MDEQQVVLEPQQDWIILQEDTDSTSKIISPDSAKRSGMTVSYKVTAVGPGYWDGGNFIKMQIRKNDHVLLDVPAVAMFTYKGINYKAGMARNVAFKIKGGTKDVD